MTSESPRREFGPRTPIWRWLILLLGLLLPQAVLYGPSLVGAKILLPLDILQTPRVYLPLDPLKPAPIAHNLILSDGVFQNETNRRFAAEEIRAGRWPLWNPYNYCGAPFLAANNTAVLSPFRVLDYIWPSPVAVAWGHLLQVLVAGVGTFLFFDRVWKVSFLAAAIGAWCFPLNGFLTLWSYQTISAVATWLPWVLWLTDGAVRRPRGGSGVGLALVTAAILLSGHAETGAHVLLASGLYFIWCMVDEHGWRGTFTRAGARSAAVVVAGWTLGTLLSAPQSLPTLEYLQESYRVAKRVAGVVETSPMGLDALPQMILPYIYGSDNFGSLLLGLENRQESAAMGYAGLLVTLVFAPLALSHARLRPALIFCVVLGVLGACSMLDLPLLQKIYLIPPLNLLRNNRFLFVTAWAFLAAGVAGLDAILRSGVRWNKWYWSTIAVLMLMGGWCLYRYFVPAPEMENQLQQIAREIQAGSESSGQVTLTVLDSVRGWFARMYLASFALCMLAAALWALLIGKGLFRPAWGWGLAILALSELTVSAWSILPQADPKLYYPPLQVISALARAPSGRICGVRCFPPCLNLHSRIPDVRGYDGADPARIVELLKLFAYQRYSDSPEYAVVQYFVPQPESPLSDLLNIRYFIHRGRPPDTIKPMLQFPDYWVVQNPYSLPRAFIPRRAEIISEKSERLRRLADPSFDPREVAYVETSSSLPPPPYKGLAQIIAETPLYVRIRVDMQTAGLLLLADSWNRGWTASFNGKPLEVMPTNHAFRGVIVPTGVGVVEYRYDPASFRSGLWIGILALMTTVLWAAVVWRRARRM